MEIEAHHAAVRGERVLRVRRVFQGVAAVCTRKGVNVLSLTVYANRALVMYVVDVPSQDECVAMCGQQSQAR